MIDRARKPGERRNGGPDRGRDGGSDRGGDDGADERTTVPPRVSLQVNISPDDPSIPVLTERLTLPPLDLDLDFTLPPINADKVKAQRTEPAAFDEPDESATLAPLSDLPETVVPEAAAPETSSPEPGEPAAAAAPITTLPAPAAPTATAPTPPSALASVPVADADESESPASHPADPEPLRPPELRIPTSLRVAPPQAAASMPPLPVASSALPAIDPTPATWPPARTRPGPPPVIDEVDLRESILIELANSLPQDVETIVRQQMDAAIERAVKRFAANVRMAIAASIREILDRAVKAELKRRKK